MDSPLQKHTHLAGMSILTVQMETNHPLSYLTPPLLAFSQSVDRPGLNLYLLTVLGVCFIPRGVADGWGLLP